MNTQIRNWSTRTPKFLFEGEKMPDPQYSPHADFLPIDLLTGRLDLSPGGIVAQRLAFYRARLDQVHARGGAYLDVNFSPFVQDLLARLEAGATLAAGKVH